jgi:hypothetical protein
LCHLRNQRLGVAQKKVKHGAGSIEFVFHDLSFQAKALSGALHHRATRRGLAPHKQRNPHQPFVSNDGDFR